MRFSHVAFLGVLSITVGVAAACGSSVDQQTGGTTTGAGGSGGEPNTVASSTGAGAADAGTDADNGQPSTMYPAPHPAPPQVVSGGGKVLTSPKIVPVFFKGDDPTITASVVDFVNKVGPTQYWKANTYEYGVGPATDLPAVDLDEVAPATLDDSTIQTWLAGKLNGADPLWPAADANTIFLINYPTGTSITLPGGFGGGTSQSCVDFGGYHSNITLDAAHGNQNVAYAVIPRCADFGGMTGIDAVTATASHELIEAATDPYPQSNTPGYAQPDQSHFYWLFGFGGGETADMCAQMPDAFTKFAELPYTVQRSWSNVAVKQGHDPCVPPLPGEVYFNAVPVLTDNITINIGQSITMKGVKIPVGQTKTIDLDLYSDGDTGGPFTVDVKDLTALAGGQSNLELSLDRKSGVNGEKLHLTIKVLKANQFQAEVFYIISQKGPRKNLWLGLIGN
jgi:hypothetical protein